jgi:hypothetical protein
MEVEAFSLTALPVKSIASKQPMANHGKPWQTVGRNVLILLYQRGYIFKQYFLVSVCLLLAVTLSGES